MVDRRKFLKTVVTAGGIALIDPRLVFGSFHLRSTEFFGIHPFIENNPDAVFIMRTDVDTILKQIQKRKNRLVLLLGTLFLFLFPRVREEFP